MHELPSAANLLFLRDEELRLGVELMFFAQRDLNAEVDAILETKGLGRGHHRVIHFVGRQKDMPVSTLIDILGVRKQTLSRYIQQLIDRQLVEQKPGILDRRQRLLNLTNEGRTLERALWERQKARISAAFRAGGSQSVDGFRKVLLGFVEAEQDRARFERGMHGTKR